MSAQVLSQLSPIVVVPPQSKHTASLIFLHGSGHTGDGVRNCISDLLDEDLEFPHIRVIYPTAPVRKYTSLGGKLHRAWFDHQEISPFGAKDVKGIDDMCGALDELVKQEVQAGIPRSRIVMGGFSMGAGISLYYGYRFGQGLAGIFALSSFLSENSIVYKKLESSPSDNWPPLYQCHGDKDSLTLLSWGQTTHERLKALGLQCTFHKYSGMSHEMTEDELTELKEWIEERLPNRVEAKL